MLKVQLISPFFQDIQDKVEDQVLELLHKLLGELRSSLLKKHSPNCKKKLEQICLKSLLQRFGEIVCGRKKLKTFAKDIGTKTVRKHLGGQKMKFNIELEESFLEKIIQKLVPLAKTFSTKQNEYKSK